MKYQMVRVWRRDGFVLKLWDTHRTDRYGKAVLAYKLYDHKQLIFKGDDFHASPMHVIDSDETVAGLLAFLSLRPGDTDREYFERYTRRQLSWCRSGRAEQLSYIQCEMEERA